MAKSIAMERVFKVKNRTLASRCEVCHQSDRYDAVNNICRRCCSFAVARAMRRSGDSAAAISIIRTELNELFKFLNITMRDLYALMIAIVLGMVSGHLLSLSFLWIALLWMITTCGLGVVIYNYADRRPLLAMLTFHTVQVLMLLNGLLPEPPIDGSVSIADTSGIYTIARLLWLVGILICCYISRQKERNRLTTKATKNTKFKSYKNS